MGGNSFPRKEAVKERQDNKANLFPAVPGLARGLRVLEFLAEHPEGRTQKEIADGLGFPFSSVSRITLQLEAAGYLRRDSQTKAFRHTMKMLMTGQRALAESDLVGTALPVMRRLRDALQDTVVLGVLNDKEIIVIESAVGTHLFKFQLNAGHRINIPASAPGKAIVAFLPEDQRDKLSGASISPVSMSGQSQRGKRSSKSWKWCERRATQLTGARNTRASIVWAPRFWIVTDILSQPSG